jgi:hypothetical protein
MSELPGRRAKVSDIPRDAGDNVIDMQSAILIAQKIRNTQNYQVDSRDRVDARLQERRKTSSDDLEAPTVRLRRVRRLLDDPKIQKLFSQSMGILLFMIHFVVDSMISHHDDPFIKDFIGQDRMTKNVNTLLRSCRAYQAA